MTKSKKRRRRKSADAAKEVSESLAVQDLSEVRSWIPTGCTLLDIAVSGQYPGGVPLGHTVHILGGASTAKTVLGMTILGAVQRVGGIAIFLDPEYTFDPVWAKLFGLDCSNKDNWKCGCWWKGVEDHLPNEQPGTIEELFDIYIKKIVTLDKDRPKVVVVDSLTALPSEVELKDKMEDGTYGTSRPKQIGLGIRKYLRELNKSNTTIIFIDQTRDQINSFGKKETVSGGRALQFYSSVRIHLKEEGTIKNKSKKDIGVWLGFKIIKNKVAAPGKASKFSIIWDYGLDDITSNLEFLKEFQELDMTKEEKKSGRVEFDGKKLYVQKMIDHIEKNNLEKELQQEVALCWEILYETESRKRREWS